MNLRSHHRRLGTLGIVLGCDMVVLFVANVGGINTLVLLTGGLASVILGPIWWCSIGSVLWAASPSPIVDPAPVAGAAAVAGASA